MRRVRTRRPRPHLQARMEAARQRTEERRAPERERRKRRAIAAANARWGNDADGARSKAIRENFPERDPKVSDAVSPAPEPEPIEPKPTASVAFIVDQIERRAAARLGGRMSRRERRAVYLLTAGRILEFLDEFPEIQWKPPESRGFGGISEVLP